MAQQTAVEWLKELYIKSAGNLYGDDFEKALAMEKEQIIKAVRAGHQFYEDGFVSWIGEQYYNEIYNK